MELRRLAIVGTGLIGASVALAAKRAGAVTEVAGFDPDPFRIEVVTEPPGVRLLLIGEIDLSTADVLKASMEDVTARPVGLVVLDLGGVTFLAVCGLRALLAAHNAVEANGGRLQIHRVPACAQRLLSLSRLDQVLDVR